MNDIYITLSGNVAAEPRQYRFDDGMCVTSLRLATTPRVFDRASQTWRDGETSFYAVRCYRALADNVARSVRRGQPIVVHGKLRIRSYEREGDRRFTAEVEAVSIGHDLRRGVTTFQKPQRVAPAPAFDDLARERPAVVTSSEGDAPGGAPGGPDFPPEGSPGGAGALQAVSSEAAVVLTESQGDLLLADAPSDVDVARNPQWSGSRRTAGTVERLVA